MRPCGSHPDACSIVASTVSLWRDIGYEARVSFNTHPLDRLHQSFLLYRAYQWAHIRSNKPLLFFLSLTHSAYISCYGNETKKKRLKNRNLQLKQEEFFSRSFSFSSPALNLVTAVCEQTGQPPLLTAHSLCTVCNFVLPMYWELCCTFFWQLSSGYRSFTKARAKTYACSDVVYLSLFFSVAWFSRVRKVV